MPLLGRAVNGTWDPGLVLAHINMFGLWTMFLALNSVLVKTDHATMVAYINRHSGTCSLQLHRLVEEIIMWCSTRLLSLQATHVLCILTMGAYLHISFTGGRENLAGVQQGNCTSLRLTGTCSVRCFYPCWTLIP